MKTLLKQEDCSEILDKYSEKYKKIILPSIDKIISRYMPMSHLMGDFFKKLKTITKTSPYPADELDRLVVTINSMQQSTINKD